MSVVRTSLVCQFFLGLWRTLAGAMEGSRVVRFFRSLGLALARTVESSRVCQFLWREGVLSRSWGDSLTCKLLILLFNIPVNLCKWLYRAGKEMWDTSLVFRAVHFLCSPSAILLGLSAAVTLMVPHERWNNLYSLYMAVLLCGLFAVGVSKSRNRLRPDALGPYFIFFMVFVAYGFLSSLDWGLSIRFVGFYLAAFLLCLLAVSSIERYEDMERLCVLLILGLTVAALYGCYQGVTGVEVVANQQDLILNKGMPGRAYSFFDNPNNFAELMVMLTPLTYALFLNARTLRGKIFAAGSFAVTLAALGYTYSRSGWLGMALATVVFIAFWNWRVLPLLVVLGFLAVPLLPETIYNRILTIGNTKDSSTSYRFAIYGAAWRLMQDYWFRGVGLGSDVLKQTFKSYPTMFDGNWPIHTHNNYLQMWAETGLLGGLSFLAAVLHQLKEGTRAVVGCRDRRVRNLLAAAVAGFCGIVLISVAEYTWFYARNMFLYFLLFGLISAGIRLSKEEREPI